jgi:hypothetical protein
MFFKKVTILGSQASDRCAPITFHCPGGKGKLTPEAVHNFILKTVTKIML